jgi:hypothetical protein
VKKHDIDRLTAYSRLAKRELTPTMKGACVRVMRRTTEAGDFRPEATASLFAIGGLHFLITAAHVFDGEPSLWLENASTGKIMTLVGQHWRNDEIDLGFVELPAETASARVGASACRCIASGV